MALVKQFRFVSAEHVIQLAKHPRSLTNDHVSTKKNQDSIQIKQDVSLKRKYENLEKNQPETNINAGMIVEIEKARDSYFGGLEKLDRVRYSAYDKGLFTNDVTIFLPLPLVTHFAKQAYGLKSPFGLASKWLTSFVNGL